MKHNPTSCDTLTRFFFDDCDMRGEMITLKKTVADAVAHQQLPPGAKALLAEFLSAAALLAGILKFEGLLTLQIRGDGDIPLIMAEATHNRNVRGIVKLRENDNGDPIIHPALKAQNVKIDSLKGIALNELVGNGVLTLTIDPEKGQRYQGIVPLEGADIAECLTHYFNQSEQLATKLWLFSHGQQAGGFFLQALPASAEQAKAPRASSQEQWETLDVLASSLTPDESLNLAHTDQLHRLFNEFEVRVAKQVPVQFCCSCSQERSENALVALGKADAYQLLTEQPEVTIDCQFCGQVYRITAKDLDRIFPSDDLIH